MIALPSRDSGICPVAVTGPARGGRGICPVAAT